MPDRASPRTHASTSPRSLVTTAPACVPDASGAKSGRSSSKRRADWIDGRRRTPSGRAAHEAAGHHDAEPAVQLERRRLADHEVAARFDQQAAARDVDEAHLEAERHGDAREPGNVVAFHRGALRALAARVAVAPAGGRADP
jgi:hypothetical protein